MSKFHWRQFKTIAMVVNRRQWERDFSPIYSSEEEIMTEDGTSFLITEDSDAANPNYFRTE